MTLGDHSEYDGSNLDEIRATYDEDRATANSVPRDRVEAFVEWTQQPASIRSDVDPTTVAWNAGWDAALAVQATETEALRAALRDVLNEFNEQDITRSLRRSEWVGKERIVVWAALTDHGTSPSQDAQEPT